MRFSTRDYPAVENGTAREPHSARSGEIIYYQMSKFNGADRDDCERKMHGEMAMRKIRVFLSCFPYRACLNLSRSSCRSNSGALTCVSCSALFTMAICQSLTSASPIVGSKFDPISTSERKAGLLDHRI